MAELSPTSGKDKRLRKIFFEVAKLRSIVGFAFPSVQGLHRLCWITDYKPADYKTTISAFLIALDISIHKDI